MGFRKDAYATVWSKEDKEKYSTVKLSVSKKNKETGEYETDFSGFTRFVGEAKNKLTDIEERDRIQIKECDVTTRYDKEKDQQYTNFLVFDFEKQESKKDTD